MHIFNLLKKAKNKTHSLRDSLKLAIQIFWLFVTNKKMSHYHKINIILPKSLEFIKNIS